MPHIRFRCPHCGRKIQAAERAVGITVPCPECRADITVPSESDPFLQPTVRAEADDRPTRHLGPVAKGAPVHERAVGMSVAGWVGLGAGAVAGVLLPHPLCLAWAPLFLVAFLLGVGALGRGRRVEGLALVILSVLLSAGLGLLTVRSTPRDGSAAPAEAGEPGGPGTAVVRRASVPVAAPPAPSAAQVREAGAPDERQQAEQAPESEAPAAVPAGETEAVPESLPVPEVVPAGETAVPPAVPAPPQPAPSLPARATKGAEPLRTFPGEMRPFVVYSDCAGPQPYYPSGWMGDLESLEMDECWEETPHGGSTCIRCCFHGRKGWGGIAWQDPPNNWGTIPGGYNLTGMERITFWARGEKGGEEVEFKVGLLGAGHRYRDTVRATSRRVPLWREWRQYSIPLDHADLTRVITAFLWVVESRGAPVVFYLDDIQFE